MKRVVLLGLATVMMLPLISCGGGDALKGTWTGTSEYGDTMWKFDGKGGCHFKTEYNDDKGTYSIEGTKVTIKLDAWEKEKIYEFKIENDALALLRTDPYSPEYKGLKKK